MERLILGAWNQTDLAYVNEHLENGWILNPHINNGQPIVLNDGVIYHLSFYTKAEIHAQEDKSKIVSVLSVPIADADYYIRQGYEVDQTFSKTVNLVKKGGDKNEVG